MVGGLEHEWYCFSHHIGNFIIPTDELTPSFFRGVGQPPTRWDNQGPGISSDFSRFLDFSFWGMPLLCRRSTSSAFRVGGHLNTVKLRMVGHDNLLLSPVLLLWYIYIIIYIEWASALVPPTPYLGGPVERGREREREKERKKER